MSIDPEFGRDDLEIIEQKTLYSGFFKIHGFRLRHRLFKGGWSRPLTRELFHRGQAAAAIAYDPTNQLVGLVDQFRIGALDSDWGPWCLEVVAGMLDKHESPEALIRRELREEAGVEQATLIPITSYYSTPGGSGEKIHLFCALCDLVGAAGLFGLEEEGEDIRFQVVDCDTVLSQLYHSRLNNAATLIALQWLQLNRERLSRNSIDL